MDARIPLLIDFDGVINLYGKLAPYSKNFFEFLQKNNVPACILSNSTLRTSQDIKHFFEGHDLHVEIPIITAADATLKFVEKNYKKISVYCVENVKKIFEKYIDNKDPQAVIIGDLADGWSIEILNEIFLKVLNGADIVAMHLNKYWSPQINKYVLDAGSYISAIEYATEKKAVLIGKPSPIYFQTALEMLGFSKDSSFLMLGDDIELDTAPAKKLGSKAILILTGKTKLPIPNHVTPDFICKDLFEVIITLKKLYQPNQ